MEFCPGRTLREAIDSGLLLGAAPPRQQQQQQQEQQQQQQQLGFSPEAALSEASLGDTVEWRWRITKELVQAVVYIHQNGVIHRDLKPSNVFLKVTDGGGLTVKVKTLNPKP